MNAVPSKNLVLVSVVPSFLVRVFVAVVIVLPSFKSSTFWADKDDTTCPVSRLTNLRDAVVIYKSLKGFVGEPKSQLPEPYGRIDPVTVNAVSTVSPPEPLCTEPLKWRVVPIPSTNPGSPLGPWGPWAVTVTTDLILFVVTFAILYCYVFV